MTIILPLINQSIWHDNELRYCLRSLATNVSGFNDVLIIGHKPAWLKMVSGIRHMPYIDKGGYHNKEANIKNKILAAMAVCGGTDVLFANDDHFILHKYQAARFPYYHKGLLIETMQATDRANRYYTTLHNTWKELKRRGYHEAMNYDAHCPILYNKKDFMRIANTLHWPNFGYAIKTMYCIMNGIKGLHYTDMKLHSNQGIETLIKDRAWFSIGDRATGIELETVLQKYFPGKMPWEQ